MIYKCRSKFKRSLDKVFSKRTRGYEAAHCCRANKASTNRANSENSEIKGLVEDISDFSSSLKSNEFSDVITRHFMREHRGLPS